MLALDDVSLHLGDRLLLRLSLVVAAGEVVTLMGPSGIGKSSLLAYVGGHLGGIPGGPRGSGAVRLGGVDVTGLPPHRRRIGLLFQDALLFAHLSVAGNLLLGLHPGIRGRAARRAAVAEALAGVGLGGFEARQPTSLSGGQRARVALLRVLLSRPRALLLDEPFGGLDAPLRAQMRELMFARVQQAALPTLLVTHDQQDAPGRFLRLA